MTFSIKDYLWDKFEHLKADLGIDGYRELVSEAEVEIREGIVQEDINAAWIWRITWMKSRERVHAFYSKDNSQASMEKACETIAVAAYKRPVKLERVITVKEWK